VVSDGGEGIEGGGGAGDEPDHVLLVPGPFGESSAFRDDLVEGRLIADGGESRVAHRFDAFQECAGVAGEVVKDLELVAEGVEGDAVVGVGALEELDEVLVSAGAGGPAGIEGVHENDGDAAARAGDLWAVGDHAGREFGDCWLFAAVIGKKLDGLGLSVLKDLEIALFEARDGMAGGVPDDHFDLDEAGGGAQDEFGVLGQTGRCDQSQNCRGANRVPKKHTSTSA